jgi:hypothetical protein
VIAEDPTIHDPRFAAAIEFIRRTGARSVGIRYQDDEDPVVWMALARFSVGRDGIPVAGGGETRYEVDAAFTPLRAALRLCERLADGGICAHCGRPSGLDPDSLDRLPLDRLICWYQFDPELKTFRRGCEGET